MILDFDASARESLGLWLIFPQQDNKKYFVPEEKISAYRETDEDVIIYLVSKTSGVDQFRIENASLDNIKDAIDYESYIPMVNQDGENMLIAPRGINAVRLDESPLFEIRVASQDCIWGEGNGTLSYIPETITPQIKSFLDSLLKSDRDRWSKPIPS